MDSIMPLCLTIQFGVSVDLYDPVLQNYVWDPLGSNDLLWSNKQISKIVWYSMTVYWIDFNSVYYLHCQNESSAQQSETLFLKLVYIV